MTPTIWLLGAFVVLSSSPSHALLSGLSGRFTVSTTAHLSAFAHWVISAWNALPLHHACKKQKYGKQQIKTAACPSKANSNLTSSTKTADPESFPLCSSRSAVPLFRVLSTVFTIMLWAYLILRTRFGVPSVSWSSSFLLHLPC